MRPRFFIEMIGGAALNCTVYASGYAQMKRNHEWYLKQPESRQRQIYENCPLQKYGSAVDGIAAINERILTANPDLHQNDVPLRPFSSPSLSK